MRSMVRVLIFERVESLREVNSSSPLFRVCFKMAKRVVALSPARFAARVRFLSI